MFVYRKLNLFLMSSIYLVFSSLEMQRRFTETKTTRKPSKVVDF